MSVPKSASFFWGLRIIWIFPLLLSEHGPHKPHLLMTLHVLHCNIFWEGLIHLWPDLNRQMHCMIKEMRGAPLYSSDA